MIKVIAIDDEPLALMVIENYCSRNEHVELVKTFSNLKDAQKYINQFPIDLMFLDIQISRTKWNGILQKYGEENSRYFYHSFCRICG